MVYDRYLLGQGCQVVEGEVGEDLAGGGRGARAWVPAGGWRWEDGEKG